MNSLLLLGTGSGSLNPERNASAYLLQMPGGDLLLDAGEPVAATLRQRGYDWHRLAGIVITHAHADHLGGLPMLIQQLYLSRRTGPLTLCGPPEYIEKFGQHWGMHYLPPEAMSFEVRSVGLGTDAPPLISGALIQSYPTGHLLAAREKMEDFGYPNRGEAYAVRLTVGEACLVYSGDVNSFADIRAALTGSTLAVIDSTHVDLESVLEWAGGHPETQVVLSHVATDFNADALAVWMSEKGLANVEVAVEGRVIPL